jgi:signal transduction histidine kinase
MVPVVPTSGDGRASAEELAEDVRVVLANPVVGALLEAVDGGALVLNVQRQIVASNVERLMGPNAAPGVEQLLGLRPGDALRCRHRSSGPDGCGSADACEDCGSLCAITLAQEMSRTEQRECLIAAEDGATPLELRVRATPIVLSGRRFTVVTLRDVSHEKRREMLEHVFLHDLANTVAAISSSSWALAKLSAAELPGAAQRIARLVEHLRREIAYQRALLAAEAGTLVPEKAPVATETLLGEVVAICSHHAEARTRTLGVENLCPGAEIETDCVLALRVLVNMVKNALEATEAGATVRLWCEPRGEGSIAFSVHNDTVIPERVLSRIFQRSFSTKPGRGRGLGTYSMKLLGERYLGGTVSVRTGNGQGTTFSFALPVRGTAQDPRKGGVDQG